MQKITPRRRPALSLYGRLLSIVFRMYSFSQKAYSRHHPHGIDQKKPPEKHLARMQTAEARKRPANARKPPPRSIPAPRPNPRHRATGTPPAASGCRPPDRRGTPPTPDRCPTDARHAPPIRSTPAAARMQGGRADRRAAITAARTNFSLSTERSKSHRNPRRRRALTAGKRRFSFAGHRKPRAPAGDRGIKSPVYAAFYCPAPAMLAVKKGGGTADRLRYFTHIRTQKGATRPHGQQPRRPKANIHTFT